METLPVYPLRKIRIFVPSPPMAFINSRLKFSARNTVLFMGYTLQSPEFSPPMGEVCDGK
jgi:hypothetical protein